MGTVVVWREGALGNYSSVLATDARRECGQGFCRFERVLIEPSNLGFSMSSSLSVLAQML